MGVHRARTSSSRRRRWVELPGARRAWPEVIERARKVLYAKRTEANRLVKERQAAADQAAAKAGAVRDAVGVSHAARLSAETVDLAKAQGDLDAAKSGRDSARAATASG